MIDDTVIFVNAILASDFSRNMESWFNNLFHKGIPSVYDKAVDAVYNATHIGGGNLHRLFDGSHTFSDMWEKVKDALPDDSFWEEIQGFFSAFGKDLSSPTGIPVISLSKSSYERIANFLKGKFNIPKSWFGDLLHINAIEIMGTSIATLAIVLHWNDKKTKEFTRLIGSTGIVSTASANPALAIVSIVAFARLFNKTKKEKRFIEFVEGFTKGGIGTGIFLATASFIPGPVWVGLLAAICITSIVERKMEKIQISDTI